jgi:glycosyltransferase involved in cell wall biosynthesis
MSGPGPSGSIRTMHVITRLNVGGAAMHVIQLNSGLEHKGYDCLIVTGSEGPSERSMRDAAIEHHLRLEFIPDLGREIAPKRDLVALIKLYRLMRRERPHIVHTHLAKAGFLGRIAARLARVPIVLHSSHGHIFHGYFSPRKTRIFLMMERLCGCLSTRIIVSSDRLRDEIASFGITKKERIEVIPYGFELDAFALQPRSVGQFRHSLDLPEGISLIGTVGRLVPIKNIPLLLESLAIARQQNAEIHLVVVGGGELRVELETRVRNMGLADTVVFAGWQPDLLNVYADLDAIVLSSDNEGTPVALIEAMAAGCPVVATHVGGVPDLITDGETGRMVLPRDPEALARALLALFEEPEKTSQMALRAQQRVLERHQARRVVADVDRLYQELLRAAGHSQPAALSRTDGAALE